MREKRFYVSKSSLYGVTVYDRDLQTPAFGMGAECNMDEMKAVMLAHRLNRRGQLVELEPFASL